METPQNHRFSKMQTLLGFPIPSGGPFWFWFSSAVYWFNIIHRKHYTTRGFWGLGNKQDKVPANCNDGKHDDSWSLYSNLLPWLNPPRLHWENACCRIFKGIPSFWKVRGSHHDIKIQTVQGTFLKNGQSPFRPMQIRRSLEPSMSWAKAVLGTNAI